ncbi:D-isomer specific 2-hydroxyacid dehydrogenase [Sphaerimonospora thailandensis]|uniref:D-isomer specific 2-hydroxyacid dehydrogenase n=1 Tax=Sphaerimonospora thailandensis TaxID=795644 RepID=A0A8J3VYU9_9ACTN|nr:D-isomer specific 2-hydroxyacid dehydrogenase [Sphaerimonospora thailandensis]
MAVRDFVGETAAMDGTILVTGAGIDMSLLESLREHGLRIPDRPIQPLTEEELIRGLRGAVAYVHGGEERATAGVLASARETLKVVAFLGVGYENFVDVAAADGLGIVVTSTPGAATDSVTELTIGQIINANRHIGQFLGDRYPGWRSPEELPHELRSRRVGIVGLGANGTRIAEVLRAFHTDVAYFSRTRKPDVEERLGLSYLPLPELAGRSDILVVMVPCTAETRFMIDVDVLKRLRPGAVLINTARPAVVDPHALHEAMSAERVGMAVFDGFYDRNSEIAAKLLSDFGDRLLVTGHIASHTREAMDRMVSQAVGSIKNVLSTGADEYAVGKHGGIS